MQLPPSLDNNSGGTPCNSSTAAAAATVTQVNEPAGVKLVESKTICYCSNFDLNVNEWFNEYENIEIFKINMKKNLGKYRALLFVHVQ